MGAYHYLTNRFQMEAPVAPSQRLQEGFKKPPWVWLKPSRSLQRPRRPHEALVKATPLGACHYLTNRFQMKAPVAPLRSLREASVGMAEAFSARDVFMKCS